MFGRQQPIANVRYGELVQALEASPANPRLSAQKVQVSHAEIRGDFVSTDRVSTGTDETTNTQTVPFRTARTGFERDQDVYALLRASPGSSYQGEEAESALKSIGNVMLTVFMVLLVGVVFLFLFRWMTGGSSPFSFGR